MRHVTRSYLRGVMTMISSAALSRRRSDAVLSPLIETEVDKQGRPLLPFFPDLPFAFEDTRAHVRVRAAVGGTERGRGEG